MSEANILLVEDEPVTAMAEKSQLEKYGFTVKTIDSGLESIEYINNRNKIDLVLMDIFLDEDLDGIEAAKKIRENHDIPIVFLTAHENPELLERARELDNYNYLLKDISGAMLNNAIHRALKFHKAQEKIKEQNRNLKETEEQYRKIVQNSRDATAIIKSSEFYLINRAFIDLTEYHRVDLIGKNIKDFDIFKNAIDKINVMQSSDREDFQFEFELITASGDTRYIDAHMIEIEIQNKPAYVMNLYDITEQKELLEEVEKAREMSGQLDNLIPICARCKKIRNEEVEETEWLSPEQYISDRLPDVDFTHSICPECLQKLYSEYPEHLSRDKSDKGDNQ